MRYMTAGESHGPEEVAIIEGIPAGLHLTQEDINTELARRQHAAGRGQRQVIETDTVTIMGGVRHQVTLGSPIALNVHNDDHNHWTKIMDPNTPADEENSKRKVMRPRPGHADLVGGMKYRHAADLRNVLERSSARETVMRVAVGAVAKRLLAELGIDVHGFVLNIGPVRADAGQIAQYKTLAELRAVTESFPTRTLDAETDEKMRTLLDDTKRDYNTVGGTVQVIATGVPVGLGSYVSADTKLDAKIARAIIGINAFKGVEFGGGFENAEKFGSEVMDEIYWSEERGFYRGSNNLGGFEGGMTNGEPVVVKGVVKPIPTLYRPMQSVDIDTHENHRASVERSDTTAVTAAAVIAEHMVAIELATAILDKFDTDNMDRLKEQLAAYRAEIKNF
ncbi:chorismate synthase [Weissella confusa]|jgi:chorismate synthase|uniref:chorismate synthase n=1 Tax=Weissella confusa TaxID=1583 RepID=UPI0005DC0FBD|nr:chorismate synthase [Weissella confusa]COI29077.1 chorismate synthase [Streptococcus pneumoniae]MBJ7646506.1 chorismate synthase [Weissella confusa]MBJ7679001.1 chorismate synthase [Weissella confusa]MCT8392405.1 chorismate synthase [Weissella confusa]MED4273465.1 chorismate synthase [Weissella confusa]